jgi:prevent-host-death family protein
VEQKTVDIRELGTRLEQLLEDVKAGATLVITDQGKPIARMTPSGDSLEEKLQQLVDSGFGSWSGGRPSLAPPPARVRGPKTLAELLVEDRR